MHFKLNFQIIFTFYLLCFCFLLSLSNPSNPFAPISSPTLSLSLSLRSSSPFLFPSLVRMLSAPYFCRLLLNPIFSQSTLIPKLNAMRLFYLWWGDAKYVWNSERIKLYTFCSDACHLIRVKHMKIKACCLDLEHIMPWCFRHNKKWF